MSQINIKKYIQNYGRKKKTVKWNDKIIATENITIPSNISLRITNKCELEIADGVTVTFEGSVHSGNDEWIKCSPDNPPIFKKRSSIRVDEFIGDDTIKIQCAINSASWSNHCNVKLRAGATYSSTSSIYLTYDETNNVGFSNISNKQGRLLIEGGGRYSTWPELVDGTFETTTLNFTNSTGDCIISDLTSQTIVNRYASRAFELRGFDLICNTSGRGIYFNSVNENVKLQNLTVWNKHFSGHGIFFEKAWATGMQNVRIYGNRDRVADASLNTGIGLHFIPGDGSVGGGSQFFENVTVDGWKYGMVLGGSRYSDILDPSGAQNIAISLINCTSQNTNYGVTVGSGWKTVRFAELYTEACIDVNIDLDNGCSNIKLDTCYINMMSNPIIAGIQIGHDEDGSGTPSYNDGAYNVHITNCRIFDILDSPGILRNAAEVARAASYVETSCTFAADVAATSAIARDFRSIAGASPYQGPSMISGEEYTGSGTFIDGYNLGMVFMPLYVKKDHIKFGRPIVSSEVTLSVVANVLDHEYKANSIVVISEGDIDTINTWERGMNLYLLAGNANGFTLKRSNLSASENIRTVNDLDYFVPYTRMVHLRAILIGDKEKWVQQGVETVPSTYPTIQYFTDPSDGICLWNGETSVLGIDGTTDIEAIETFIGDKEVFLWGRESGGVTIKHNATTPTHKIVLKSGRDTLLRYHKMMHLVSVDDSSYEHWVEVDNEMFDTLYDSVVPINGSWNKGDKVWNDSPDAGEYMGWVCVVAGTPGTWKGFGLIES